jgi:hypothetical protein
VVLEAQARLSENPPQATVAPGGLYPLHAAAYEVDEYRIMAGWPVPVPPYEIRANTMISAIGEVFAQRSDPTSVVTDATVRWVADADYYSVTDLKWRPLSVGPLNMDWGTSGNYAPVLIPEYEYRVKNERFYRTALNFDSDTRKHMWLDMSGVMGGLSGYTVIMVMSPNSQYGNNLSVPYNGLWCPGRPSPGTDTFTEDTGDSWMGITMQGQYLYLETESKERTRGISINPALNDNAPMYLAMVFQRPDVVFYVGEGPSSVRVKTLPSGEAAATSLNGEIVLGRTTGDVLHTADMALFDLGIYTKLLTATEVAAEFSKLSQAYGGDM